MIDHAHMRIQIGPGCLVTALLGLAGAVVLLTMGLTWQAGLAFGIAALCVVAMVGVVYARSMTKLADQVVTASTDPTKLREQASRLAGHGMLEEAVQTQLQAIKLLEEDEQEHHHELVQAHLWLGRLYDQSELRLPSQALDHAEHALAILHALTDEGDIEHLRLLGHAQMAKGGALLVLHRDEDALAAFTQAADTFRRASAEEPAAAQGLAGALDGMTIALRRLERTDEATQSTTEAENLRPQPEP